MRKRLILVGKAASGKDHARKICEQSMGMQYQVSYTTRPPREGEVDGKDYFFLTDEQFIEKIDADEWYEFVTFNGWYYGTSKEQFNKANSVFIMTPTGVSHLSNEDRKESLIICIDAPAEIRRARMNNRQGNADSVERRLKADHLDFLDFENYDVLIEDPHFTIADIAEPIRKYMARGLVQLVDDTKTI
jgi:guanylate kinase